MAKEPARVCSPVMGDLCGQFRVNKFAGDGVLCPKSETYRRSFGKTVN